MIRQQKHKKQDKTVASRRNQFKVQIRQEELNNLFRHIRENAVNNAMQMQFANHNQIPMQMGVIVPPLSGQVWQMLMQQYYANYVQFLSQFQNQNQVLPVVAQPLPVQIPNIELNQMNQVNPASEQQPEQIYFQKENFRVYKKLIGQGSYSKVWEGVNLLTHQKIAAKQIKKLQDAEYKCLKSLNSEHIIKIHHIVRHHRSFFIILEFCQRNLKEQLVKSSYSVAKVLDYFEQIVKGMTVLQERNLIHRDLKFQNILISKEGVIKIADFGLAKYIGDQMEVQSRRCGTPYTMAPQIYFSLDRTAPYTTKCDIWSLGILLHQMLYQKHPFKSNKSEFKRGRRVKVQKRFGLLDEIIDRCLIYQPDKRISWYQLLQIYQFYCQEKIKKSEGDLLQLNAESNAFPINAESIIYEEKPEKSRQEYQFSKKKNTSQKKHHKNKRQLEYQRKFENDYDAALVNDSKYYPKEMKYHKKQTQYKKEEKKVEKFKKVEEPLNSINYHKIQESMRIEENDRKLRQSLRSFLQEKKQTSSRNNFYCQFQQKKEEPSKKIKTTPKRKKPGKDLQQLFPNSNLNFINEEQEQQHQPIDKSTLKYVPRQTHFYHKTASESINRTRKIYEQVVILIFIMIFLFILFSCI